MSVISCIHANHKQCVVLPVFDCFFSDVGSFGPEYSQTSVKYLMKGKFISACMFHVPMFSFCCDFAGVCMYIMLLFPLSTVFV